MCSYRAFLSCLSFLLVILFSSRSAAQTYPEYTCYIKYDHDAAGNRISKYWYCCCLGGPKSNIEETTEPSMEALLEDLSLQLFPNPAKNDINVSISGDLELGTLEIHDVNGRMLRSARFQGNRMNVSLEGLAPGLYNMRLLHGQEMLIRQFVVE